MFDFLHDPNAPITNVIMVSADIHTGGGIDDGRNNRWGIPEMSISHTNLDAASTAINNGRTGTWSEVSWLGERLCQCCCQLKGFYQALLAFIKTHTSSPSFHFFSVS